VQKLLFVLTLVLLPLLAACNPVTVPGALVLAATPTPDPDIYNQVPDTTVYQPGRMHRRARCAGACLCFEHARRRAER
jgi:hypothetical protein